MPLHDQRYQSHSLRRHQKRKKFRVYLFVIALLTVLVGVSYVIFGSRLFRIEKISIVGVEPVHHDAILNALRPRLISNWWNGLLGMDHFWTWPDEVAFSDMRIRAVKVKKDYANGSLTLSAIPRERFLVWCKGVEQPQCFWVDSEGIAFMDAPITEGQLIYSVSESDTGVLVLGSPAILSEQFVHIKKILEGVRAIEIPHTGAVLDRKLQELHLRTIGGTRLLFSIRFDPEKTALPGLAEFVKSPGLATLNYVDFTVENRAFYQPR